MMSASFITLTNKSLLGCMRTETLNRKINFHYSSKCNRNILKENILKKSIGLHLAFQWHNEHCEVAMTNHSFYTLSLPHMEEFACFKNQLCTAWRIYDMRTYQKYDMYPMSII